MKAKRGFLPLVLFALLLLAPACALADEAVIENDAFILAIDRETLSLTLTEKESGEVFRSGPDSEAVAGNAAWKGFLSSTLSIEYTADTSNSAQRVDVQSAETVIGCEMTADGADFAVDFTGLGQRLTVKLRLHEDGLSIAVPGDSIEEYGATQLCGLYLLPCFGATRLDEEAGYMLVPEAAGAIIRFSDGRGVGNTPYAKRIYGGNVGVDRSVSARLNRPAEEITMPVYGMAYTDRARAFLAVVEAGEEAAELLAYPAGVITEYNWAAARFILRESYIRQTTRTMGLPARETGAYLRDMSVRFYLLKGDEADYAGMARKYRALLEARGALRTVDARYRPRLDFLGAETEAFLLWDQLVTMTTFRDAREILADALSAGLTPPLINNRGWLSGGLSRNYGSGSVSLERRLGSRGELAALRDDVEAAGGQFCLELDPVQANPNRMYNMRLDIVRSIGQTVAVVPTGKDLYPNMYYLTPLRTGRVLADYADSYAADFPGLALATLPDTLYSYYSAGRNHTRGDTRASYEAALDGLSGMRLALKNPLAAYYPYMAAYLDLPLNCTSYSFLSAEVPFLPMVLSGHVPYWGSWNNFDSNQRRQMLKLVEYGAFPSFLITAEEVQKLVNTNSSDVFTAQWDVMRDTVLSCDEELRAVHAAIGGRVMTDHTLIGGEGAQVRFGDDVTLIVNYADRPLRVGRTEVPALGYVLLEGGKAP